MDRNHQQRRTWVEARVPASALILIVVGAAVFVAGVIVVRRFRSGPCPLELGRHVDAASAVSLAEVLSATRSDSAERTVVRGKVGEVCRSAGCWFVLQEVKDGRLLDLYVDLKRDGTFTVPKDASGRTAFVSGTLVGVGADTKLEADGVRLE